MISRVAGKNETLNYSVTQQRHFVGSMSFAPNQADSPAIRAGLSCWWEACFRSDRVGAAGGIATPAGPVGVAELAARLVEALVGVGAKVVALGLQQVGR